MPINHALKEFLTTEKTFIESMNKFTEDYMANIFNNPAISKDDIEFLSLYVNLVDAISVSYNILNLDKEITDSELLTTLQSSQFESHLRLCSELALKINKANKILSKVEYTPQDKSMMSFSSYTILPLQRMPRYVMLLKEAKKQNSVLIAKQEKIITAVEDIEQISAAKTKINDYEDLIPKIEDSLKIVELHAATLNDKQCEQNGEISAADDLEKIINRIPDVTTREMIALRSIIMRPFPKLRSEINENNAYIKTILTDVYKDLFTELNSDVYLLERGVLQEIPIDFEDIDSLKRLISYPELFVTMVISCNIPNINMQTAIVAIEMAFNLLTSNQLGNNNHELIARKLLDRAKEIDPNGSITKRLEVEVNTIEDKARPMSARAISSLRSFSGSFFRSDSPSLKSESSDSLKSGQTSDESSDDDSVPGSSTKKS